MGRMGSYMYFIWNIFSDQLNVDTNFENIACIYSICIEYPEPIYNYSDLHVIGMLGSN